MTAARDNGADQDRRIATQPDALFDVPAPDDAPAPMTRDEMKAEALHLLATTNMSQRAVAARLGTSEASVRRWRKEATQPTRHQPLPRSAGDATDRLVRWHDPTHEEEDADRCCGLCIGARAGGVLEYRCRGDGLVPGLEADREPGLRRCCAGGATS
ncbi:hypothetical protein GS966_25805 [Rhodococcus hoagii]|nr:hypothetical protein [Prescottella equi]